MTERAKLGQQTGASPKEMGEEVQRIILMFDRDPSTYVRMSDKERTFVNNMRSNKYPTGRQLFHLRDIKDMYT